MNRLQVIKRFIALAVLVGWSLTLSGCGPSGKDLAMQQGAASGEQLRQRVLDQADR